MAFQRTELIGEDKNWCVFVAPYKRIGVKNFIRSGWPEIRILAQGDSPERFRDPQVELTDKGAMVNVFDEKAIDLRKDDLLGEYREAAKRCDEALLKSFPEHFLTRGNLNEW